MPYAFEVTPAALRLDPAALAGRSSVDVRFGDRRVWSIDLLSEPLEEPGRLVWPRALLPYLDGRGHVSLSDSLTGEEIAADEVAFGRGEGPLQVVDANGRHLAVNKWGRLGKSFEGAEPELRTRVLDRLDELVAFCEERDLRPFVVGGTLLGAVREGRILGHDDDADLAYLSHHTHPSDLALESYRIERELVALGIEVVRHSTAHLQLTWRTPEGKVDAYVDLFTAFFREDGTINQPFHVRGSMAHSAMLPFSTVTLEGRTYPAPAKPEDWLVLNYDENWRTPLPGYVLRTPINTRRRFDRWFGSFNFNRDFWEETYEAGSTDAIEVDLRGMDRLLSQVPGGATVLDLGCGTGEAALHAARAGHHTIAVDYSPAALARLRQRAEGASPLDLDIRRVNLVDWRQMAALLADLGDSPAEWHVIATHLLERMGMRGRRTALRLMHQMVRQGGRAVVLFDTRMDPGFVRQDPRTWHLELSALKSELADVGLMLVDAQILEETDRDRVRRTVMADIVLDPTPQKEVP